MRAKAPTKTAQTPKQHSKIPDISSSLHIN
ncbi:uncharacterized protein G2W53_005917 [Senna tora]|uniref:Uncharacterized protein n=1 Tax=Senna tora TaxID=362788 RepID=A0A835CEA4_9FABA|nr:uncharacterized protein G2W53_005917 [Senna tora]